MNRNNIYNKGVANATRRFALGCLLLFFMVGSAWAQTTGGQYVIKKKGEGTHYLAHVNTGGNNWELQDTIAFSPSCLWISDNSFSPGGTNKNYYFYDNNNTPRFLVSPEFQAGGRLELSNTIPTGSDLGTPEFPYYFYRWDSGLGRGVQYFGVNDVTCQHEWEWMDDEHTVGECWEVYWVSYDSESDSWKLSEEHYGLADVPNGARYHAVTITEHPQDTTAATGTGLRALSDIEMVYGGTPQPLAAVIDFPYSYSFTPVYTEYVINEGLYNAPIYVTHNYYDHADHLSGTPQQQSRSVGNSPSPTYHWTKFGDGAAYLTISDPSSASPTLTYSTLNDEGDKLAYLVLTVTYSDGSKQRDTAEVTVKTPCRNPRIAADPVVTDVGVTVSWYPSAESYTVSWKEDNAAVTVWNAAEVGNVTSYTIRGLAYGTNYVYKVKATSCETEEPEEDDFTTNAEPAGMIVYGAIFGGGRMANVGGNTEVVLINFDSIGAVYGGNDIAGAVQGNNGSTIVMGVNTGGAYASYGTTTATVSTPLKFGSVYGGGNGYYAYNGTSFVPATSEYTSQSVAVGASVREMTPEHTVGEEVWTNNGEAPKTLSFPTIKKTSITVTDNYVKADSIFGGAKNAFLTHNVANENGSFIDIKGGTIFAVFGGNNFGGTLGAAKQHIEVHKTNINLASRIDNTATTGYGRTFGIRYLFGGGNKVDGSATDVYIYGGQLDSIFAGGNSADVAAARLEVNCSLGADAGAVDATGAPDASGQHLIFGNTYTNAFVPANYTSGSIGATTIDTVNYAWDGYSGIYNVRTLFGGNNKASMEIVPNIVLTSGSVGIVYGGGNAGDMVAQQSGGSITFIDGVEFDNFSFTYSTHVVLNSDKILVDYLYGGCQMSNVLYSTWVELQKGHVGYVYGGCNISGDVGSTRSSSPGALYQDVYGATYVTAKANTNDQVTVYKDLFAGGNGYYHCSQDGIHYSDGDFVGNDPLGRQYIGLTVPTHNETHAVVSTGATIRRNVYAGGNLACVGFDDNTGNYDDGHGYVRNFPELVGLASVRMEDGLVKGNVYGGGNMASIFGSNEVRVTNGTIKLGLYGGNDCSGQVAEKTNRVLPQNHTVASDGETLLTDLGVKTYVGVKGNAKIGTVYGGGNGDYDPNDVQYCYANYEPIQRYTFVDIHINGGVNGGKIRTVYGGGNGVTVRHGVTVFLNVNEPNVPEDFNNVDTIFGGNNKGNLAVVPDIRLIHGQVGTVYGGCNRGMMTAADDNLKIVEGYENIGSYVRLRKTYKASATSSTVNVTAKVKYAVYGGCRMNGVTNNSLVLVEGGDFSEVPLFGGSDISGTVSGDSRVVVVDGTVGRVYGGGNGYYTYDNGNVYTIPTSGSPVLVATGITNAPICANSGADILGGNLGYVDNLDVVHEGNAFGGGYGELTSTTDNVIVNVGTITPESVSATPLIYGNVYGGSALGSVNTNGSNSTTVNYYNGRLHGNVFGGGLGDASDDTKGWVMGKVYVNIGYDDPASDHYNCLIDLRDANVFGCNNTNGSPKDDVEVHVWKTAHTATDSAFYIGTTPSSLTYAIDQVFGGGNQANYNPSGSGNKAMVYVHGCSNTIRRVFSGGNAAAALGVTDVIEGGRFDFVFGGGNGEDVAADIGAGGTHLVVSGGDINHLFGGSNEQGVISGPIYTEVNGDNTGCMDQKIGEFFGGSNMAEISTSSGVYSVIKCGTGAIEEVYGGSKKANITGDVTFDVRGGTITNVFGGSMGVLSGDAANITGNVTLNLEGGSIQNAYGGSNYNGNITGTIKVNVIDYELEDCELDLVNVYGGGNLANYTPSNSSITSPVVNVMHVKQDAGVKGNVFGGGNRASVEANTRVNIGYEATAMSLPADLPATITPSNFHTFVSGNVFGGGNEAGVDGNTTINVYDGEICQSIATGAESVGLYGGCNTSGTVTGNATITLTGGTVGNSTTHANIHGGGYGSSTSVAGDVTINYGEVSYNVSNEEIHVDYPVLYGDMYGGSALGDVNTNGSNTTTIQIDNGTIHGNVYGGGLGRQDGGGLSAVAAKVYGVVHVYVGKDDNGTYRGKASFDRSSVFGSNNLNGSPQENVYVDVYQTNHTETDLASYAGNDRTYAIYQVFGGGNQSNYHPDSNSGWAKKTYVTIHGCLNTIEEVFGGSNAAHADGVHTVVDGGRFNYIFGGGNGIVAASNVSHGGTYSEVNGGHVGYWFGGSNRLGNCENIQQVQGTGGPCGEVVVDYLFNGGNMADQIGDMELNLTCSDPKKYLGAYGGCRLGTVYGNITINISGGTIGALYGGCRGASDYAASVKKYDAEHFPENHPELVGTGGNITINVYGGAIGELYGGCDVNGNVEGKITINVHDEENSCGLFIGNVYGSSNQTDYTPLDNSVNHINYSPTSSNPVSTPEVNIIKGTIGGYFDFDEDGVDEDDVYYDGNVFGGGNKGNVTSNPKVVIGDTHSYPVTIKGSVFGGGNEGNVNGSPKVIIVPTE